MVRPPELSAIGTGSIISVAVSENTADDIVTTVLVSAKTAKGISPSGPRSA